MTERHPADDRKLRILHVLRAPLGGLFRHVLDLAREQVARGHDVGLVVDSLTGGARADAVLAELDLALGLKRIPMLRQPNAQDVGAMIAVHRHARKLKADVIHGHGSKGGLYARAPGLLRLQRDAIRCYTPHGGSFNFVGSPVIEATYMGVEKLLARTTDVLLFESVFIANRFKARVGETRALVRIVQNGISADEFAPVTPDADAAEFVYVGELRAAKGIDTLIDATAMLTRKLGRRPKLVLVGSGPDEAKLERQAQLRGIRSQVVFAGPMPARRAFALGRTLVVPSRAESLPYIVLEAAGAQIPMIATDVGGISEVFGPYRDQLIRPDVPATLMERMRQTLEADPSLVRSQTQELSDFVAGRFSISIMTDSVVAGYRDGLLRRAARAIEPKRSYALPS